MKSFHDPDERFKKKNTWNNTQKHSSFQKEKPTAFNSKGSLTTLISWVSQKKKNERLPSEIW